MTERLVRTPTVWLVDLTHGGSGPASETMPVGVAFLAGYVTQECHLREPIRLFKYPARLAAAIEGGDPPTLLGFSHYVWNSELSLAFARLVRRRFPSTVIVFGGPHFPKETDLAEAFLRQHPEVDCYVEGEGEQALAQLVHQIGACDDWRSGLSEVPSLRYLDATGRLHCTPLAGRLGDLDVIPSPYLSGMLDEFFDGKLVPTLQTNRGCPFRCTFCLEGDEYYRKLSSFSEERVIAELDYIGQKMESVIRNGGRDDLLITNSNFAMYPQDRSTCIQIKSCKDRYGWPARVNVTTGKNRRKRVLESIRLTHGAVQLSGAVQSLERSVLENVNRHNIDAEALMSIAQESAQQGTPTYSDVILGLPGDTRRAHMETVRTLVNAGFGRINTFQCALLPGTELYARPMRERYGIQTKFRTIPRGFGRYPVGREFVEAVEIDEICVETSTMSFDDYVACRVFDLALFMLYNDQVMSATVAVARRSGVDLGSFLIRVAQRDWQGRLGQIRDEYVTATHEQLFDTREACTDFALANMDGFVEGRLGRNLLYTYRAMVITEAVEEMGRLALDVLAEDMASVGGLDLLAEAVRFDVLCLSGLWDPNLDGKPLHAVFEHDIVSLLRGDLHVGTSARRQPVQISFELSHTARATRDAYARAMGRDVGGIGRALTRVPIGDLKRVGAIVDSAPPR